MTHRLGRVRLWDSDYFRRKAFAFRVVGLALMVSLPDLVLDIFFGRTLSDFILRTSRDAILNMPSKAGRVTLRAIALSLAAALACGN